MLVTLIPHLISYTNCSLPCALPRITRRGLSGCPSIYRVRIKKYPPKVFWQYFSNDWQLLNEILHVSSMFIIFNFDKVMLYQVLSSSEFLHFTWKTRKNRDTSATIRPISIQFGVMMQNICVTSVPPIKNSLFLNPGRMVNGRYAWETRSAS